MRGRRSRFRTHTNDLSILNIIKYRNKGEFIRRE